MRKKKDHSKLIKILRWIARICSILALLLAIGILLTPGAASVDKDQVLVYWVLTGIWLVGVLGLLIAWRWELAGAIVALAALISRDMFYFSLSGKSFVDFKMIWLPIMIPALLFIVVWWIDRGKEQVAPPWINQ